MVRVPGAKAARTRHARETTMANLMTGNESNRTQQPADPPVPARKPLARRLAPLAVILAGIAVFFALGLDRYLSIDTLRDNREALQAAVADNPVLSAVLFGLLYAVVIAFSLPGGALMTVTGGFLFGPVQGTAYVVVAATLGATALFLVARSALGDGLRDRAGPWISKMRAGFTENELSYMLFLRLVPAFPFFVVNLVPAFLGVSTRSYVIATLIGIIPGTAVYATFGAGLGAIFESGTELTLKGVLSPELIAGLVGLGVLSLLPALYKKIRGRRG